MTILEVIIGLVAGLILGYLSAYFREKGKNKALLGDIKRLTAEKESVIAGYKLDIEKRKYKYESKRDQYFKYFNLIDDFGKKSHQEMYDTFYPIIDEFNRDFLGTDGNKQKELETLNRFSAQVNRLVASSNDNLIKLRQETNTIKLIAGDNILNLLGKLEKYFDLSFEKSTLMLKEMGSNIISGNPDRINEHRKEVEELGAEIIKIHQELIKEVRNELDEI